jgi:hypothetical protein
MYGSGLSEVFGWMVTLIIILFIGVIGFGGYTFFKDDAIKSKHLIKPEIQLIIKDNKVDTLYVYRKP